MTKVLIATPSYSWSIPFHVTERIYNQELSDGVETTFITYPRMIVHYARNSAIKNMLQRGFDYLFFVDDDNVIPKDALEELLQTDWDIVSWLYRRRVPPHTHVATLKKEKVEDWITYPVFEDIDRAEIEITDVMNVDWVWCWCMLISREVCEYMYYNYSTPFDFWDKTYIETTNETYMNGYEEMWVKHFTQKGNITTRNGKITAFHRDVWEDITFCHRAKEAWYNIKLRTDVEVWHIMWNNEIIYPQLETQFEKTVENNVVIGMCLAPRDKKTVNKCIKSLRDAGITNTIYIQAEPWSPTPSDDNVEVQYNLQKLWCLKNHNKLLERLNRKEWTHIFLIQDDYEFAENTKNKIETIVNTKQDFGRYGFHSSRFHKPNLVRDWRNQTNYGIKEWRVCYLMEQDKVNAMLQSSYWQDVVENYKPNQQVDGHISEFMKGVNLPMYVHNPSLAKHIGETSTVWHDSHFKDEWFLYNPPVL